MMRFASLGSGSSGNALLVESGGTRVLVDCGFGVEVAAARLERAGCAPADLNAVLVTHEHSDHAGGVAALSDQFNVPVYLTRGTFSALGAEGRDITRRVFIDPYTSFVIGAIEVRPFTVPHDAREPVQFVLSDGAAKLGVLTDAGVPTRHIVEALSGVDALVLECNYDLDMLLAGPYPKWLKKRIGGRLGHLDNTASAEIVRQAQARDRGAPLQAEQHAGARARGALGRARLCGGVDRYRDAGRRICLERNLAADARRCTPITSRTNGHKEHSETGAISRPFSFVLRQLPPTLNFYVASHTPLITLKLVGRPRTMPVYKPAFRPTNTG
jgi:phosphoribosyl 1,2-cyclic phosphodiesterase